MHHRNLARLALLVLLSLVAALAGTPTVLAAPNLVADYQMQNALTSTVGSPPALTEVGTTSYGSESVDGTACTTLQWTANNGIALNPTTPTLPSDKYTIVLLVKLTSVSGFRKLIDFANATNEAGLYNLDGNLYMYPLSSGSGSPISADTFLQIVLTRDSSGTVTGYVDGVRYVQATDTNSLAVIDSNHTLRFFLDDSVTNIDASSGSVARLRLYDDALTAEQVAVLDRESAACGGAEFMTFADNAPEVLYGSWLDVVEPTAGGGHYAYTTWVGSSASMKFKGTSVTYFYFRGPGVGKVDIYLDKVKVKTLCGWAPITYKAKKRFKGLANGKHTIQLRPTGKACVPPPLERADAPAGDAPQITLDRFVVGGNSFEESAYPVVRDGWRGKSYPAALGGKVRRTSAPNSARFNFSGDALQILSLGVGGTMDVTIDANAPDSITLPLGNDPYAKLYTGLGAGAHSVLIQRTSGTVVLDGFRVLNQSK